MTTGYNLLDISIVLSHHNLNSLDLATSYIHSQPLLSIHAYPNTHTLILTKSTTLMHDL